LCSSSAQALRCYPCWFSRPQLLTPPCCSLPRSPAALRASLPRGTGLLFIPTPACRLAVVASVACFASWCSPLSLPAHRYGAIPACLRQATFDPALWVAGWSLTSARGQVCSCNALKTTKNGGTQHVNQSHRRQCLVCAVRRRLR